MKRISDESGIQAGARNVGRFFLFMIPWALGTAALVWLAFFMGAHEWFNTLSQGQRRAIYVGAEQRPKSKLKIETPPSAAVVDRVDLEGSTLAVYFHALAEMRYGIYINWQLVSPDGTLLSSGAERSEACGGPTSLKKGEKGEAVLSGWLYGVKTDSRAEAIRVWVSEP